MAEKRNVKRKKKGDSDENGTPTKDEKGVAQYLRFNLETKKAQLYGNEAFYFYGNKAVDFLLDSKWAKSNRSSVAFTHRESIVSFMNRLINYGIISHVDVIKIEKRVKDRKKDDKKKDDKKDQPITDEKDKKGTNSAPGTPRAKKDGKETKKVKKKVKTTLEYNDVQLFFDDENEAYVWTYDPLSWTTLILGVLLVLGVILVCLFPLWPENIREYSWYLSVAGAVFVGAILALAVFRYILYGMLWLFTFGKLHFWLLPNLTAECGFFESFVPLYEYETREKNNSTTEKKKSNNKVKNESKEKSEDGKDKISDSEKILDEKEAFKNESEESSEGMKDEEWVKVKKPEAENVDAATDETVNSVATA